VCVLCVCVCVLCVCVCLCVCVLGCVAVLLSDTLMQLCVPEARDGLV